MNHLEVWELERQSEDGDAKWLRYVTEIEAIIGRHGELDGDEGDGFSLDGAHDAWRAGVSPAAYVKGVRDARR